MSKRQEIKPIINRLLEQPDYSKALLDASALPLKLTINAMIPKVLETEPRLKWHAVTITGNLIGKLGRDSIEDARIIIRRLLWNLTEESGGCPIGTPELIGEALANNKTLAREYINLLISMIIPEGNYLEFELLLCGVIWGIGRVAGVNPELTKEAVPYLKSFLNSENPVLRGYSCWALKKIGVVFNGDALEINCAINDDSLVDLYSDNKFYKYKVSTLAKQLIQSSN